MFAPEGSRGTCGWPRHLLLLLFTFIPSTLSRCRLGWLWFSFFHCCCCYFYLLSSSPACWPASPCSQRLREKEGSRYWTYSSSPNREEIKTGVCWPSASLLSVFTGKPHVVWCLKGRSLIVGVLLTRLLMNFIHKYSSLIQESGGEESWAGRVRSGTLLPQVDIEHLEDHGTAHLFTTESPPTQQRDAAAPPPPLVAALRAAAGRDEARFHFPGHNGGNAAPAVLSQLVGLGAFVHDLPAFDDLFPHQGPLLEAQRKAAELFGSSETWFLVGGTTCGVQASIMATCSPSDTLVLPRDSHLSATSGMVLSGAVPKYVMPADYDPRWGLPSGVTASQVERAIGEVAEADGKKAAAVLVTSPTYQGVCSNLREISQVCHSHGVPLIVDEAHGAHFRFHREFPETALEQGADLAVQSTHKVLCSLTQSSMLHMSTSGRRQQSHLVDRERLRRCLRTLQSTSPSPLLLASLDAARAQLSDGDPEAIFDEALGLAAQARDRLKGIPGISVLGGAGGASTNTNIFSGGFPVVLDPLRLTVRVSELGLSGFEAADVLEQQHQIAGEMAGARTVTYAVGLGTRREDVERLVSGFKHLSASLLLSSTGKHSEDNDDDDVIPGRVLFPDARARMSPREAFFAKKTRRVETRRSAGEVCGELICPYPPGIPVLAPGEVITEGAIEYLLGLRDCGAVIGGAADPQLSSIVVVVL